MQGSALHRNITLGGVLLAVATVMALLAEGHAWALLLGGPLAVVAGLEVSARRNRPVAVQSAAFDLTHTRLDGTLRRMPSPTSQVVELAAVRAARRGRTTLRADDHAGAGLAPVVQLHPVVRDERVLRVNG